MVELAIKNYVGRGTLCVYGRQKVIGIELSVKTDIYYISFCQRFFFPFFFYYYYHKCKYPISSSFRSNKNFQSDKIQSRRGERTGVRVVYNFYPRRCSIILYYIVFSDTSHLIPEFIDAIHRDYDAICNNNGSVNYTHSDNWFKLLEWSFVETNELYKWEKKNKNKKYAHTTPCITYTHHLILYPWTNNPPFLKISKHSSRLIWLD